MRIHGPNPIRKLSRGTLLGGAILGVVWGWTAIEAHWLAPMAVAGPQTSSDVIPIHLSLSFKRTRKLAYQRWMNAHKDSAPDPEGMTPVAGTLSAGGKTFITRISAFGENSFALDLAPGDSWNGARSLRLTRKEGTTDAGEDEAVDLDLNGHPEGRYFLSEAPTLDKMLRQGKRMGVLFHLAPSGRLSLADESADMRNPVMVERRKEALAKVAAGDPRLFSDPSLARARAGSKALVVFYDPDSGTLLPVGPDGSAAP
jgi:hypothetical protein